MYVLCQHRFVHTAGGARESITHAAAEASYDRGGLEFSHMIWSRFGMSCVHVCSFHCPCGLHNRLHVCCDFFFSYAFVEFLWRLLIRRRGWNAAEIDDKVHHSKAVGFCRRSGDGPSCSSKHCASCYQCWLELLRWSPVPLICRP